MQEKECVHQEAILLTERGFITVDHLKFSEDIEKIYLREEKLDEIQEYLREQYEIIHQSTMVMRVRRSWKSTGRKEC